MGKRVQRKFRNALIEVLKALMVLDRGATVRRLSEDLGMNYSNIHHRIKDLEEAGIVECIGQMPGLRYSGKRPRVYALSRAIRSTQYDVSGTPGLVSNTNT